MKMIVKWTLLALLVMVSVLVGALVLMVDESPLLSGTAGLTPERIARGKRVFDANDPRRLKNGAIARVSLSQDDLDLALNYFANQYLGAVAGMEIDDGRAVIKGTLNLPANPLGRFLNFELELKQTEKLPHIDRLTLGKLWLPGLIGENLVKGYAAEMPSPVDWKIVADMIRRVSFEPRRMIVSYRWQGNLPGKLTGALWTAQDLQRLEMYQRRLAELMQGGKNRLELTELARPLFQLANDRSQSGAAIAENRALILVLAFYVNQKDLTKIVQPSHAWPRPNWRRLTLNDRDDLTKHYLVSAMLAAYAGTPLSDALGLYKEIEDARGGSGFSFNDIAADRAGTRMGELATSSESRARKIQMQMAEANESDIMPVTSDLPEFMSEAEFTSRFGGTQDAEYRQMMDEIEKRIATLPVNRE